MNDRERRRRISRSIAGSDERGAVLVLFALLLVILLGMVALAVDIGMFMNARTESQRVADASALAGAGWLREVPTDVPGTQAEAIQFASRHAIRGQTASVLEPDVNVQLGPQRVTVTVYNTQERGNAIPTIFGRILGRQSVDVVTYATAEVAEAGNPFCDLPIAMIDKCQTADGKCESEPFIYDSVGAPHYEKGEPVEIKLSQNPDAGPPQCQGPDLFDPCDVFNDGSWHCWYLPYPEPQDVDRNEDLVRRILGYCPEGELISAGDIVYSTPGQAMGTPMDALVEFIDLHPDEHWNQSCGTGVADGSGNCLSDPKRVRSVPIVRPDAVTGTGNNKEGEIVAWAGVFLEKVACSADLPHEGGPKGHWNLYTRFVPTVGQNPAGPATNEPTLKVLRLVE